MARVLIASSGGGHAAQARLLIPAFKHHDVLHVMAGGQTAELRDCSISTIWRVMICLPQAVKLIRREQPDFVISTGALPGLLAIIAGRIFGAETIWVDSVANAQKLSLSGRAARLIANRSYSQWPDVAARSRVQYAGAVI